MLSHLWGVERGRPGRTRGSWKIGSLAPVEALVRGTGNTEDPEWSGARGRKRAASRDRESGGAGIDEPPTEFAEEAGGEAPEQEPVIPEVKGAAPSAGKTEIAEAAYERGPESDEAEREAPSEGKSRAADVRSDRAEVRPGNTLVSREGKSKLSKVWKMGKPETKGASGQKAESGKNKDKTDQGANVKAGVKGESSNKGAKIQTTLDTPVMKYKGQMKNVQQASGGSPPGKRSCSQTTPPGHSNSRAPNYEQNEEDSVEDQEPQSPDKEALRILDPSMQTLLKSLPTRQDLDTVLNAKLEVQTERLEQFVEQKIHKVQEEVSKIATKLSEVEEDLRNVKEIIKDTAEATQDTKNGVTNLALQVLDLENRNRRDNIRIRGIPESVGQEELGEIVTSILNYYLDRPPNEPVKIERMHRVAGSRSARGGPPRDVVCKLHHYPQKDAIIRAGWEKGPMEVRGAQVIILQDLASKTLYMRKLLKPLLEIARSKNISYRWGYPFALTLRKENRSFTLRTPAQLPGVFKFLDCSPVEIPDWMSVLVDTSSR